MAGSTCTIGGVAFLALASTAGRYCLECKVSAPMIARLRYHPQGVDGQYIITGGRISGGPIVTLLRYIGTMINANNAFIDDAAAWYAIEITIKDESNNDHTRCNLDFMTRTTKPMAMGRGGGLVFFDAAAQFSVDS